MVLGFGLCSLIWYFRFLIYVAIVFEFSFIGDCGVWIGFVFALCCLVMVVGCWFTLWCVIR